MFGPRTIGALLYRTRVMKLKSRHTGVVLQGALRSYGSRPELILDGTIVVTPSATALRHYEVLNASAQEQAALAWAGFKLRFSEGPESLSD